MKKFFILSTVLFAFFTILTANETSTQNTVISGTVTANRLNLRMAPSLQSPRAGVVIKNTQLNIVARHDNWLALEIPSSVKVFVSEAYIHNNKTIRRVAMRSGMSASAPTYGDLPKGFEVKTMDERNYGWVRIVPPAHLRVYAVIPYISCDVSLLKNEPYTPQDIVVKKENKEVKKAEEKVSATKETEKAPVKETVTTPVAKEEVATKKATQETSSKVVLKKEVVSTPKAKEEVVKNTVKPAAKEAEKTPIKENIATPKAKVEDAKVTSNKAATVMEENKKNVANKELKVVKVEEKEETKTTQNTVKAVSVISWNEVDAAIKQLDAKRTGPVKVNGILVKVEKSINAATEYAIIAGNVNLGFVSTADKSLLSFYLDKQVAIEGDKYVVSNWKAPVIKAFSIKLAK